MALVLYMPGMVETEPAAAASASVRQRRRRFALAALFPQLSGCAEVVAMASRVPQGDSIDEIIRLAESKVIFLCFWMLSNIVMASFVRKKSGFSTLANDKEVWMTLSL